MRRSKKARPSHRHPALIPERIIPLTEAGWAGYFEQRVQPPGRDELLDVQELQAFAVLAQLDQLGLLDAPAKAILTKRLAAATDPDDPAPGIRTNPNRTWEQVKQRRGVVVDAAKVAELKAFWGTGAGELGGEVQQR